MGYISALIVGTVTLYPKVTNVFPMKLQRVNGMFTFLWCFFIEENFLLTVEFYNEM